MFKRCQEKWQVRRHPRFRGGKKIDGASGCYKPVRTLPYGRLSRRWGKPCIRAKRGLECAPTHRRVNFVTFTLHPIDGSSVSVAQRLNSEQLLNGEISDPGATNDS